MPKMTFDGTKLPVIRPKQPPSAAALSLRIEDAIYEGHAAWSRGTVTAPGWPSTDMDILAAALIAGLPEIIKVLAELGYTKVAATGLSASDYKRGWNDAIEAVGRLRK